MYKMILSKLKNRKILVLAVLLFFAVNIFAIYTTFSEKTTSIIWDGTIAKKFNKGSGTSSDPYIISNGGELAFFFTVINSDDSGEYFNKFYELNNNIDLNGYDFSFANTKTFSGNFNGNGYSIFNFKLSKYYVSEDEKTASISLFDSLYSSKIQNLNIRDVVIIANESEIIGNNIKSTISDELDGDVTTLEETIDEKENSSENEDSTADKVDEVKAENQVEKVEDETEKADEVTNDTNTIETDIIEETQNEETVENSEIEPNENEDIIIESKIEKIEISFLAKNVEKSTIQNINLNNIEIKYNGEKGNVTSSLFVLNDISNNKIVNINIVGNSNINNTAILINKYNDAEINNIVYSNNSLVLIKKYDGDYNSIFKYNIVDGKLIFDNDIPVKSILGLLNSNSDYNWKLENNMFRIQNNGVNENTSTKKNIKKIIRTAPSAHDSGISGNIVYVNDYESDAAYYEGLNYSYSSDGKTPTTEKKNIYNDTNLVYTELHYYGRDYDNKYVGNISASESQNEFVYYKIYEVNDNGTSSNKSDDYVLIELIDNPFQGRPTGKTFNGWVTDYVGAEISLDRSIYTRSIKIPVTYNADNPNNITANIYSSWTNGIHITTTALNNLSNTSLRAYGFTLAASVETEYESISGLYTRATANRWSNYPTGAVNSTGASLSGYCSTNGGCTYYLPASGNYVSGTTYYKLVEGSMTPYTVQALGQMLSGELSIGDSIAGYYRRVTLPSGTSLKGYYDSTGNMLTSGTSTGGQYYDLIQFYDSNGDIEKAILENYYYLTTRDTNIILVNANITNVWSSSITNPFTLTAIDNGTNNYSRYYWNLYGNSINTRYRVTCYSDIRIEDLRIRGMATQANDTGPSSTSYSYIYGGYYNLKIGRGTAQYSTSNTTFNLVAGGNNATTTIGSAGSPKRYRLIIESGVYNTLSSTNLSTNSSKTLYVDQITTLGSDYDRVKNDNDKLKVTYAVSSIWSGSNYSTNNTDVALTQIIKSGSFGTNKVDFSTGIYVSGRGYASTFTASKIIVEGGYIYNLNGGPSPKETNKALNTVYIYMKGGSVDLIVGGAGRSQTYGNRIIQITGGLVNYAVFGGSNGVTGSDDSDNTNGKLDGDSYIYIGGNAKIGDSSLGENAVEGVSNVEAGSVFGNGNGNANSKTIGTVNNSSIIIDGSAVINKNVYGGGNYGAAGQNGTNQTYNLNIILHSGEVKGSIYGGGNNNGAGTDNNTANINITMDGGSVSGSVYGGSRTKGTINGSTNVNIISGTIYSDVYGGGEGGYTNANNPGTFVKDNVNITIGNSSVGPTINGTVYGGSAFGTVNETSVSSTKNNNSVNVTVNNGTILNSVFGGAKGSSEFTPNVNGNVNVTINNGTIPKVFGGCDEAGEPLGDVTVYINGGSITDAYGGGNKTSVGKTSIYLEGGSVTTLYGGSNQSGTVNESNVYIDNGVIGTVFGGNNEGGTCNTSNVTLNGGTINGTVYGGGNLVDTGTTNINVNNISNTLSALYGGGNRAGATSTNINLNSKVAPNNISITSLYGGSNQLGDVITSNITVDKGNVTSLYGGNNAGGETNNTNIDINSGTITTIYGGGNEAVSGNSNIDISGGTITTIFGGGNKADMSGNTNVLISNVNNTISAIYGGGNEAGALNTNITIGDNSSGTINVNNIYGGSNQLGDVSESNIIINKGTITNVYGGNNAGGKTNSSNVILNKGTITTIYGGGNEASTDDTRVDINNGSVTTIFGGGNKANVNNSTNINITNSSNTITSVYGGGNEAGANVTNITLIKSEEDNNINITNIYGGSNQLGDVNESNVIMNTGNVTSLYGGNNAGGSTTTAKINVTEGNITNLFGGGNEAESGSTDISISNANIGVIYAGGNAAGVTNNTKLLIKDSVVSSNIYGGGNEGSVGKNTEVIINNTAISGSAYAGGNGATATVYGNTSITVGGNSVIGSTSCSVLSTCSVFGGGNAAITGSELVNDSTANVKVSGATIYGNVYGGANTSKVYGQTNVDIGADVTLNDNITKGNISIKGTVFGGGEANASGSDEYDWTFVSVTKAIVVNINGLDYDTFEILGSIFGSGNASTTTGTSEVNIKNYGVFSNPQKNTSIQRTDILTLDNSAIVLLGATDRENEFSDVLFSLSRIKKLNLTNNSTLFLETGANLLEEFNSLTSSGDKAQVNIDENKKIVTKSVDNRVYMYVDKKLNIAKNQSVTDYGEVSGMSFFGMYKYNSNGSINTGIYDDFDYGEALNWGDVFDNVSSYVLGLHKTNHDIKVDGFYTNYMDEETSTNKIDYIEPTPPSGPLYMWTIGEGVIEYEFELSASKYSTLGTYELSLIDFTDPNTTFQILGFDFSELDSNVSLVEKSNIKKIADTDTEADTIMGLSMETSNIGWLVNGNTAFLTNENNPIVGTKDYIGGNNSSSPTLLFNLYHAKNISTSGELGRVRIQLLSVRQIDALTKETKRLIITVNITKALIDSVNYEGAMTAGRKYDLFTSTATNITSSSSISAYYSLFNSGESIYKNGYHRALISNYVLPLNTKITMIDYSSNNPEYYYHVITQADVDNATNEIQTVGEVSYNISMFEVMGAENSGVYYDDAVKNSQYYSSSGNYCNEEFIFIIDFGDTQITSDALSNQLLIEIRNEDDEAIHGVLGQQYSTLTYNIYANKDAIIDMDGTLSNNKIYNGESVTADLNINYTQEMIGSTVIYDTHYFDSKLGIKISLINSEGNVVTGSTMLGLYYTIDGVRYDPNIDGTTRIKVADKVDSAEKWVIINTGTSTIASGKYTLRFESFGSPDGIYYGLNSSDTKDFEIEIVNEIYGLDVETTAKEMIIDSLSGKNGNGENKIVYNIKYNSGLTNPNIRFKMYRRSYENIDDTNYILVTAQDYFDNVLMNGSATDEYKLINSPEEENRFTFVLNQNLVTGTYKMEFLLFDGNSKVGSVEKYIIIK